MASINPSLVRASMRINDKSGNVWGTGFCFVYPSDYSDIENSEWESWYVTCAHVIDAIEENDTSTYIEINKEDQGRERFKYSIKHYWMRHKGWIDRCSHLGPIADRLYTSDDAVVDVAVARGLTSGTYEGFDKLDWWGFPPKVHLFKSDLMILSEGDEVFVIGFPIGFEEDLKNWPVVRQGVLAQIQPYLQGGAGIFLIDGSVFNGNSGGPVVTKPQSVSIEGTHKFRKNALIGMVSGYRDNSYIGIGENADLGVVIPLDTIRDTIEMARSNQRFIKPKFRDLSK